MVTIVDMYVGDPIPQNWEKSVRICGIVLVTGDEDELRRLSDECPGASTVFERDGKCLLELCMSDLNDILTRLGNKEL